MMSSGGVAPAAEAARAGAWSVLSGPAGGAVGAGLLARLSGDGNALGFDMGGTSCDVCVIEDGRVRKTDSRRVAGRVIQLPMVDVHTVGAGGGSIGWRDSGGALRVGPALGGGRARPGLLRARRLRADGHRREPRSRLPEPRFAARRRRRARRRGGRGGARAARRASSGSRRSRPRRGSCGSRTRRWSGRCAWSRSSAASTHGATPCCRSEAPGRCTRRQIARELGIERIVCPRASGVLSALGLLASERRRDSARTVMLRGDGADRRADRRRGRRAPRAAHGGALRGAHRGHLRASLPRPGVRARRSRPERAPSPRSSPSASPPSTSAATAIATPRPRWSWSTSASPRSSPGRRRGRRGRRGRARARGGAGRASSGEWVDAEVLRGDPPAGTRAAGPCVFELPEATLVLPPRLAGRGRRRGDDRRRGMRSERRPTLRRPRLDPISLQVLVGAPARRLRRDGRGADPLGALAQHHRAPRLLDRALHRRRRAGDAGGAHPRPPGLDARRGRRGARRRAAARTTSGSSTTRTGAAPTSPT